MKALLTSGYSFNPAVRKIDFSGVADFDVRRLLLIVDGNTNDAIFAKGDPALGYSLVVGSVLTLAYDTRPMGADDPLTVYYEADAPAPPSAAAKVFSSLAASATRIQAGAGWLTGYDLQNLQTAPRLVNLYDSAQAPAEGSAPLVQIALGGGLGRALALAPPLGFAKGLWIQAAARAGATAAADGDVAGTVFFL